MKTLTPEELERKMLERYNDHPLGWRLVYTTDKKGRHSIGLVNSRIGEQYWLCYPSMFSSKAVGFVGTLNEDFPFKNYSQYDSNFGVRYVDVTSEEAKRMIRSGGIIRSVMRRVEAAAKGLPEKFDKKKQRTKVTVNGGVSNEFFDMSLSDIMPSQAELEARMEKELERLEKRSIAYIR
jgi:hypothetical protein